MAQQISYAQEVKELMEQQRVAATSSLKTLHPFINQEGLPTGEDEYNSIVVPCREHFVLFYLISFLYFIYVGSNLRTAVCTFPAKQTGSLDHLSLT